MQAPKGLVASSDPRAAQVGAAMLREGGNAADAAVAAALVLYVVEPQSAGVGGDGFLIFAAPGSDPVALDGSGAFPLGLTRDALESDGLDAPPGRGTRSVTVPGALALLEDALARFGNLSFSTVGDPAIRLARDGFEVRPTLASAAARAAAALSADATLSRLYVPDGRPVVEGERICNPALADLLSTVSLHGTDSFYRGDLADALCARVAAGGGYLRNVDLAAHGTSERAPVSCGFRGRTVWELPEPTQGPAVVAALRRLEEQGPLQADDPDWAPVVEAVTAAMSEAGFDLQAMGAAVPPVGQGDTTYIAAIDERGGTASLITSLFGDFGAQFGVPEIGGPLGNRAAILRLLRQAPRPGERPPHTTIPALVTRDRSPLLALGVAGGFMQPQAQVQILLRLFDLGCAPQKAVDEPRFRVLLGGDLALEAGHPLATRWPDALGRPTGVEGFGAAQLAGWFDGQMLGAADRRRGGAVVAA